MYFRTDGVSEADSAGGVEMNKRLIDNKILIRHFYGG